MTLEYFFQDTPCKINANWRSPAARAMLAVFGHRRSRPRVRETLPAHSHTPAHTRRRPLLNFDRPTAPAIPTHPCLPRPRVRAALSDVHVWQLGAVCLWCQECRARGTLRLRAACRKSALTRQYREATGKLQGRYREGTGKVQGRYREGTGKVQGEHALPEECPPSSVKSRRDAMQAAISAISSRRSDLGDLISEISAPHLPSRSARWCRSGAQTGGRSPATP